ncbi:MAG: histidine kinase dimerization/phospho-acceptor domain-containing protein [Pseudobdellovibrio sp.]
MQTVKNNLALFCTDVSIHKNWESFEPILISTENINFDNVNAEILLADFSALSQLVQINALLQARKQNRIAKLILTYSNDAEHISTDLINELKPNLIKKSSDLTADDFFNLWDSIKLNEQNLAYISLSSELNTTYEDIKNELENKIYDKTKNLIESRRKVFEINSRIEFLRKILYTISEIKSFDTAEEKLNNLLTSYNKVTWFKIIKEDNRLAFEKDIQTHFDSTLFKSEITLNNQTQNLYFFKGDKKPFKKNDIHLFKKMSETLHMNLSRISNLSKLQKNENFFDLAFQSSKNPITVIDRNYQVIQANKAALNSSDSEQTKYCYQLLFGRDSKCVNCQPGTKFEIQNNNTFYNVHSQPLNLMEQEDNNYWVHVYEDSTEQNLYEKKLTQFARLEELGLISSSIAHELNNPLGGILSYIQIMKMELPAQHPLLPDLNLMHETALRMKKIIEDLLIFSRTNQKLIFESADLSLLVQDVLAQTELQFKVEKIKTSLILPNEKINYKLSKTLFHDTINLLLLFFIQKSKEKRTLKQNFISLVEVKITSDQLNYYLTLASNSGHFENELKTKDLNLLAVEKNLTDQGFQLFISEPAKEWIQFSILLPKDFNPGS